MKKGLILAISLALVVMLIPGCAGISPPAEEDMAVTGEEEEEEGTGPLIVEEVNFRLWISDEANAIDDFDQLWVAISGIGVVQSGGGNGLVRHELDPKAEVDLTELTGDNATEIWSGTLPDGEYTKVFIYVEAEDITGILLDGDGETADVKLPSEKLQISKPFTISSRQVVDFVFDITVVEAGQSGKYNLLPQIAQSGPDQDIDDVTPEEDLEITTTSLLGGEEGAAYTDTVVATGGTGSYTWSVLTGSLPDELELDDDTGEISGTLATGTAGDYTFTVQVEDDSAQTDTQEFTISIAAAVGELEITTTSLLGGEEGAAYTDTVVATGGTGSYTWSVLTGSLPDELELDDDTGEISGTLATGTAGDYTFTVQAEDDSAQTDTQEFTILIEA